MDCIQLSLFGKTCQERSAPTEEKISGPCWKNLPAWNNQTLQFLDLRVGGADGARPEQSPETDGAWLGDSLTLNIGESPSVANESLLSQILEVDVPLKYFLSARACRGILTRASRRGKALPDLLKTALLDMIEWWESEATASAETPTLSTLQDQTLFQPVVFDARGNGDGITVPTITGDHESRVTDYTAIAVDLYNGAMTGDKAAPITCRSIGSHSGPQVAEQITFSEQAYDSFKQSGSGGTLKGSGGAVGYGGESLVAEKMVRWIVRRLTPTECERLQGLPDGWTDIGEWTDTKGQVHKPADAPRYKALGNSIALPQWFWLVQRMHPYLKEKPALGSLFDGLGGFPLVWQRAYGERTARWASEIEEFPMTVTKRRFGEE
jgi:DNA (cytosine-5)-methyltransferase 1|nr:MAG TPA: Cytosine specific methyltransferase [Caudoviricetes sp.]